jgi:alpha-beta hydrolase superfamily lysophospholipase
VLNIFTTFKIKNKKVEFNWQTEDDITIFGKEWKTENPKAIIALVHGFGEHCMRYDAMAKYYNQQGFAMIGYDRRGHGQSTGPRGYVPHYESLLEEVDELINECKKRYPNKPIILYGHSMGGNIVLNYMIERSDPIIKLMVVTGPWIRLYNEPSALTKFIARLVRKIAPNQAQNNKIATYVSRVKEEVDKYMNDPLNHGRMSVNLACEMFKWSDRLLHYTGEMKIPTLIMHAGDDQLTSLEATKTFVSNVSGDVTFRIWDDLYHEIHNESIREQVYDYTIEWLNNKL